MPHRQPPLRTKALWLVASMVIFGLLHMTNMISGMDFSAALDQSLKAMPMGLIAGLIYLRTRVLLPLLLWHASVDFTLFANVDQPFFFGGVLGILTDACVILLTLFTVWDLITHLRKQHGNSTMRNER